MDINRRTAYDVLLDMELNHSYSNLALNNFIGKNQPDSPAFVRELVYGVTGNRILLDFYLQAQIPSGLRRVKKQDLTLLRMGLYQMLFMNSVPAYAAVSETVNLARRFCRGREGFINGVLRSFQRRLQQDGGVQGLPQLPDREREPEEYLSVKYSAARWLVDLWLENYGLAETERLLEASGKRPVLSLRVNRKKTERHELMGLLQQDGFEVEAGSLSERVILVNGKGTGVLEHRLYKEGWFSVQDQASVAAADMVHPLPGNLTADVCAAPGGKTLAMAEAMEDTGEIIAFDIYAHKLKLIEGQAERLDIGCIRTRQQDARQVWKPLEGKADCVLADVPCSGLGVIRRKPEIKLKDVSRMELEELVKRQEEILDAAGAYVKPGGVLVYSTCTINPAENEGQIHRFLERHREYSLVEMRQLLPERENDGFYICKLFRG